MSAQKAKKILVVDDDAAVVDYLCESLGDRGFDASGTTSATVALETLRQEPVDLVISDVEMPELRGMDLMRAIHEARPTQLVLLITAYGSVELAVSAVQAGACDFLTKPFQIGALVHAIERAFAERTLKREVVRLRAALTPDDSKRSVIAKSPAMRRTLQVAQRAAASASTVLLTGETGSGKSMLARFIHEQSPRRGAPFVQLNCAAVPPTLAEAELFGVRKGAFTDARSDRAGLFETAGQGTIFLDELGELSLELQAKLLHVLESSVVRPLGGNREVPTAARVIAATNRAPEALLREGRFRPDLYYRINVVRIEVPPLRERREDVVPLVDSLLAHVKDRHERPLLGISAAALRLLVRYAWPGNVRELANVIERAVALAEHDVIVPEDLDLSPITSAVDAELDQALDSTMSLEQLERVYVRRVVDAQGGNKAAAARILGITRRTLYRKLGET